MRKIIPTYLEYLNENITDNENVTPNDIEDYVNNEYISAEENKARFLDFSSKGELPNLFEYWLQSGDMNIGDIDLKILKMLKPQICEELFNQYKMFENDMNNHPIYKVSDSFIKECINKYLDFLINK